MINRRSTKITKTGRFLCSYSWGPPGQADSFQFFLTKTNLSLSDLELKISNVDSKIPSSTETPQRVIDMESKIEDIESQGSSNRLNQSVFVHGFSLIDPC